MPMKMRGGRTYWYRSVRIGGRVRSEYQGAGLAGAIFQADAGREAEQREADRAELAAIAAEDRPFAAFCAAVDEAVRLALEAAGFHRHRRSPWRRRRAMNAPIPAQAAPPAGPMFVPELPAEAALYYGRRSREGDAAAEAAVVLAKMVCGFKREDTPKDQWQKIMDDQAKLLLHLARLTAAFAGPTPTAIERALAEKAALCSVESDHADRMAMSMHAIGGQRFTTLDAYDKRRDRAHRRYLATLRALAQVRKLDITAIQVNVGAPAA